MSSNVDAGATNTSSDAVVVESDEELDDDGDVQDLLAEEILAESKEVEEETENLAASENVDDLGFPFLPPIMNIELIKVINEAIISLIITFICVHYRFFS